MESVIFEGRVRHRRYRPVKNAFEYKLFMMYLDLSELESVFQDHPLWSVERRNLASFLRRDHLGDPKVDLDKAVRDLVEDKIAVRPSGPIRLLTHLRYFGHCFNPVSFYYCFDPSGTRVETIVAEVNNTPWKERHCYVLGEDTDEGQGDWKRFRFPKTFHVSPFMGMDIDYDWAFRKPGERVQANMTNYEAGEPIFDAGLDLERKSITRWNLTSVLARHPVMTAKVVAAIYWQAFKLKWKKAPFFPTRKKSKGVWRM